MMMVSAPADRVETARHGSKVQLLSRQAGPADTPALSLPDLSVCRPRKDAATPHRFTTAASGPPWHL